MIYVSYIDWSLKQCKGSLKLEVILPSKSSRNLFNQTELKKNLRKENSLPILSYRDQCNLLCICFRTWRPRLFTKKLCLSDRQQQQQPIMYDNWHGYISHQQSYTNFRIMHDNRLLIIGNWITSLHFWCTMYYYYPLLYYTKMPNSDC